MSNIPEARRILEAAMGGEVDPLWAIESALSLMTRESPKFVAPRRVQPLTEAKVQTAKTLRSNGMALNDIAVRLGTNIGRVSEAVN